MNTFLILQKKINAGERNVASLHLFCQSDDLCKRINLRGDKEQELSRYPALYGTADVIKRKAKRFNYEYYNN